MVVPGGVDRSGEFRVIPCLLWLIERLAREHDVHVFTLYQEPVPSRYELLGATIQNIGPRYARIRTLKALVTEHRRAAFDILHAFWATPQGTVAVMAGRLLRRPSIVHVAGGELIALPEIDYGGTRSLKGRVAVRIALQWASCVTAASPPIVAEAAAMGVVAEQVVLGVDLDKWPVLPPRPRDGSGPSQLLHVASLNRVKDQGTLLRAMARLRDAGERFHLDIVGQDTLQGAVQGLAHSLDLDEFLTFHGFLPHSQLRPLFEAADILVMCSLHEGGEVVTLEAAVAGIPVVGTRVGHTATWAPDAAVAVPVGDDAGLAREITRLLHDEPTRLRLAREAQRRAVANDADATAECVNAIYRRLTLGDGHPCPS